MYTTLPENAFMRRTMNPGRTTTCDNAKIITAHMYDSRVMFPRRLAWLMKIGVPMAVPVALMATTLIHTGIKGTTLQLC